MALAGCTAPAAGVAEPPTIAPEPPTSENFDLMSGAYRVVDSTHMFDAPVGIGITPGGDELYVSGASTVSRVHDGLDQLVRFDVEGGIGVAGPLAVSDDGSIYTIDMSDSSIVVSHDEGATWQRITAETGGFSMLTGIAAEGDLVVATDAGTNGIEFSTDRGVTWSTIGSEVTKVASPVAVAIDPGGEIWVVSSDGSLSVGDTGGERWNYTSAEGTGFGGPVAIAAGVRGEIYVADAASGALARSLDRGKSWAMDGGFGSIAGLAVDPDGRIFLSDGINAIVQVEATPGDIVDASANWSANGDLVVSWSPTTVTGGSPIIDQIVTAQAEYSDEELENLEKALPTPEPTADAVPAVRTDWSTEVSADATTATIGDLPQGVGFTITVAAHNSTGTGVPQIIQVPAR
jgi:hypothetical protein